MSTKYDLKSVAERKTGLPKIYLEKTEKMDPTMFRGIKVPDDWVEEWKKYQELKKLDKDKREQKIREMNEARRIKKISAAKTKYWERVRREKEKEQKALLTKEGLSKEEIEAVRSLARRDLIDFGIYIGTEKGDLWEPAWFHEEIADNLMQIINGTNDFDVLMVFLPPGHGKSRLGTQLFSAFLLGGDPSQQIMVVSYSGELAEKFGSMTRDIVESDKYKTLFNTRLRKDSRSKDNWETVNGGSYNAVGIGGAVIGKRANVFIIDDLMRGRAEADSKTYREAAWNFFTGTALTRGSNRLSGKKPVYIFFNTRWHLDDVPGRLMEMSKENDNGLKIKVISYPAIAESSDGKRKEGEALWERGYPATELAKIKSTISGYEWSAQYQQNPITTENQEFKIENFQYVDMDEVLRKETSVYMTIDTAISQKASGDYTGITINFIDKDGMWHIATWQRRFSPKELIDFIFQKWEQYGIKKIGIEKTIYQMAVKEFFDDEMRRRGKFPRLVELQHANTNKEARIRGLIPYYESKSVKHIKGMTEGLEGELMAFPAGKHDDVIDSLAYQVQIVQKPIEQRPALKRPKFATYR